MDLPALVSVLGFWSTKPVPLYRILAQALRSVVDKPMDHNRLFYQKVSAAPEKQKPSELVKINDNAHAPRQIAQICTNRCRTPKPKVSSSSQICRFWIV